LITDINVETSDQTARLNLTRYYLNGESNYATYTFPIASETAAGMMSADNYNAIVTLQNQVAHIRTGGIYIGRSFATYDQMMATPIDPTWTENDFTYVQ
jgi:hypothetical protein